MKTEKIKTYINFAIKSRDIIFGLDNILKLNNIELIISSTSLGNSSEKTLKNFVKNKNLSHYALDDVLFRNIIKGENVKVFALKNKNLAKPIMELLEK